MHKVSEARELECRQAFTSIIDMGEVKFSFPKCSGPRCAHWRHDRAIEIRMFNRIEVAKAGDYSPEGTMTDKEWDAYVEGLFADGWRHYLPKDRLKGMNPNKDEDWHYVSQLRLTRDLPEDDHIGSCGLVMPDTLDVKT